jgi:hypothetical protein
MPTLFSADDHRRHRFWNRAPADPTKAARQGKGSYFRPGHGRVLTPDSFMPCGEHAGKHMRAVPLDYMLWVNAQPWAKHWDSWQTVTTHLENYILPDRETHNTLPDLPTPTFYVDRLRVWPTKLRTFKDGSSHLHCLPGHEDLLHAFAVGGLGLSRDWYQPGALPHYDLSRFRHEHALSLGAVLIEDRQLIAHKETWLQFFQTKPKRAEDPSPPLLKNHRLGTRQSGQ